MVKMSPEIVNEALAETWGSETGPSEPENTAASSDVVASRTTSVATTKPTRSLLNDRMPIPSPYLRVSASSIFLLATGVLVLISAEKKLPFDGAVFFHGMPLAFEIVHSAD